MKLRWMDSLKGQRESEDFRMRRHKTGLQCFDATSQQHNILHIKMKWNLINCSVHPIQTMSRIENINLFTCSDAGGRPRLLPRGTLGSSKSLSIGSSISGLEHDKWSD